VGDIPAGRVTKPVILGGSGQAIVLYSFKGKLYCSDSSSTAFQYPLVDAKVFSREEAEAVVVVRMGVGVGRGSGGGEEGGGKRQKEWWR
jgi:hypothetical protein